MTVSWHRWLARVSGAAGDDFNGNYVVDRRDWLDVGWPSDGRFWDPAGTQPRQYTDLYGCDRGLHRCVDARPFDGVPGAERYRGAAWRGYPGRIPPSWLAAAAGR